MVILTLRPLQKLEIQCPHQSNSEELKFKLARFLVQYFSNLIA